MVEMKEMEKALDDARRYNDMKARYAGKVRDAVRMLEAVVEELDPKIFKEAGKRVKRALYDEAKEELMLKMRQDTLVTTDIIEKTYPHLEKYRLWRRLQDVDGVEKGNKGTVKYLFLRK
jgi:hypothetical protein